jgi:hypothetical protein
MKHIKTFDIFQPKNEMFVLGGDELDNANRLKTRLNSFVSLLNDYVKIRMGFLHKSVDVDDESLKWVNSIDTEVKTALDNGVQFNETLENTLRAFIVKHMDVLKQ